MHYSRDTMQTILLIITLSLSWLAVVLLRAFHFTPHELTHFELSRRASEKDENALRLVAVQKSLTLLLALRLGASGLFVVIFVAASVLEFGFWGGILVSLISFYIGGILSTWHFLSKQVDKLYGRFETGLLTASSRLSVVLRPLTRFSISGTKAPGFYSKLELASLLRNDMTVLGKGEKTLLIHGLNFDQVKITDCMTPRRVVEAVDMSETLGPVTLDRLHKTGHSRFPVIDHDLDHVVGMLYLHNLVPLDPKYKRVRDAMERRVFYVHENQNLDHALHAFLRTKHHLFIVVNDFSEVVGLITIEDCLEQILGRKIVDEFDAYDDLRAVATKAANKKQVEGEMV